MKNCLEDIDPIPNNIFGGYIFGATVLGNTVEGTKLPGFPPIFFSVLFWLRIFQQQPHTWQKTLIPGEVNYPPAVPERAFQWLHRYFLCLKKNCLIQPSSAKFSFFKISKNPGFFYFSLDSGGLMAR